MWISKPPETPVRGLAASPTAWAAPNCRRVAPTYCWIVLRTFPPASPNERCARAFASVVNLVGELFAEQPNYCLRARFREQWSASAPKFFGRRDDQNRRAPF